MARTSRADLEVRKRTVLRFLLDRSIEAGSETTVSLADLGAALHMTRLQARYTVRELEEEGLIRRQMCFRDDGGQTGCSYAVTQQGVAYLTAADERAKAPLAGETLQRGR